MDNRITSQEPEAFDCSYGTSTPKKTKNSYTGWIVAACLFMMAACTVHIAATFLGLRPAQAVTAPDAQQADPALAARIPPSGGEENGSMPTFMLTDRGSLSQDAGDTRAALSPALVQISVDDPDSSAAYTGVIFTESGYLLTACGSLQEASSITCRTDAGSAFAACYLGADAQTGLTLLKLCADGLTPAVFASAQSAAAGDPVLSVSASGDWVEGTLRAVGAGSLECSAAAVQNGLGAPLVDSSGAVIGLVTSLPEAEQGATCIAADAIGGAIDRILADNPAALLFLGLDVGEIPALLVGYYGYPGTLWIRSVADARLAEAGISTCDIILAADGAELSTWAEFNRALAAHRPGEQMELTLYRDGDTFTVSIPVCSR